MDYNKTTSVLEEYPGRRNSKTSLHETSITSRGVQLNHEGYILWSQFVTYQTEEDNLSSSYQTVLPLIEICD